MSELSNEQIVEGIQQAAIKLEIGRLIDVIMKMSYKDSSLMGSPVRLDVLMFFEYLKSKYNIDFKEILDESDVKELLRLEEFRK